MDELQDRMRARIEQLRAELALGEERLRELERETVGVQQTMLRIRGAIQVLTELDEQPRDDASTEPESAAPPPTWVSAHNGSAAG